ncbi:MAG: rhodanese-like domain-containing protein [Gemmatimonadota bacterium]
MSTTQSAEKARTGNFSFVNEHPPLEPEAARAHLLARLSLETDPADVHLDLERAPDRIHVIDVRAEEHYERCHVPGSINLPYRRMDEASTADLDRGRTLVTYCWGPGCNAAEKGAARLAELGFRVKVMIGGIEYWRHEGYAVEGSQGEAAPLHG